MVLAVAGGLPACSANSGDGEGVRAAAPGAGIGGRTYEVILTDPHCDVCENADKTYLLAHSKVIRRVVELIDSATKSVDVAQYTFSRTEIDQALRRAHGRGVKVRVAMDAAQDVTGTLSRKLLDAGLDVAFVSGKPNGANESLQHNKYMIVDGATLLTGSNNWSSTGTSINEENVIVVSSTASDPLLKGFSCDFEAVFAGNYGAAGACSNDAVDFSPSSKPSKRVVKAIRSATTSIDILMHHLSYGDAVKELEKAAKKGVRVRVIINAEDRDEVSGSNWQKLAAAGGRVRFKRTNGALAQLQHNKLAIIDGKTLVNGSGNWSGAAFFNNFENFVTYTEPTVVAPFEALFSKLWRWSLSAESLDAGLSAAQQAAAETSIYFGNLHAHIRADGDGRVLDDAEPTVDDAEGNELSVDVGDTVSEATRYAFEYGRDRGALDFLAVTPHTTEEGTVDPNVPNMTQAGYAEILATAAAVTAESGGTFVGIPGMEWSTNSTGNHINIFGSKAIAKARTGAFDAMFDEVLPGREAAGERPLVQLNHPRTFPDEEGSLEGPWDQIFGVSLTQIAAGGERRVKFNDYGLDDYPPLSEVRGAWIDGSATPDEAVVRQTLASLEAAMGPYARLMEVTLGRGSEIGGETGQNPSLVPDDADPNVLVRKTKVHTDWDYYLLNGFMLAPTANHDNHRANWGTGHTSRTAIIANRLAESALLDAIDGRAVYASEDQNLSVRFHADGRTPMGGVMATTAKSAQLSFLLGDPDFAGPYEVTVYGGRVGGDAVKKVSELQDLASDLWHDVTVSVDGTGLWFFYIEVLEPGPNRMAWSAPIWIERLGN